jgi:hypothetical protein
MMRPRQKAVKLGYLRAFQSNLRIGHRIDEQNRVPYKPRNSRADSTNCGPALGTTKLRARIFLQAARPAENKS